MSRVWLCEETTAEYPFFLEEERVNLYSFEELCYYLYQNTGVLEESFFNEKLCQWLEEELGQQKERLLVYGTDSESKRTVPFRRAAECTKYCRKDGRENSFGAGETSGRPVFEGRKISRCHYRVPKNFKPCRGTGQLGNSWTNLA